MELKDLLENPGTAAFSRIKYLQRFGYDDQIAEFINGLFLVATESKHQGFPDMLTAYLERWEDVAIDLQFRGMTIPTDESIPWAGLDKPLDRCRIALVTTGGVYLERQTPFDTGDATHRPIPWDAPKDRLRIWHPGYDTGPARNDINCIFPVDRFKELEAEGVIGELAATNYSFMGLIHDTEHLASETAPEVGRLLSEAGVDAVFLSAT